MRYKGFYINLDRSEDRRQRMEAELARTGLKEAYTRFPASDGNTMNFPRSHLKESEMGCFTSHYRVLLENRNSPFPLHIIEDHAVLSRALPKVLNSALEGEEFIKFDIVYTDLALSLDNLSLIEFKRRFDENVKKDKTGAIESFIFSLIDLQKILYFSTNSYVVNPHAIEKVLAIYEYELKGGARMPIDYLLMSACRDGLLKSGTLFPFVTSIAPDDSFESTIHDKHDLKTIYANYLLRHSFFVEGDPGKCLKEAARLLPQPDANDEHNQFMLRLLGFLLT
ncbi:MAG: glycosyltransferase family 25 protein, partial [Bdellovibrionales bacterium]